MNKSLKTLFYDFLCLQLPGSYIRIIFFCFFLISACTIKPLVTDSAPQRVPVNIMAISDAVPRYETRTRSGNPADYEVLGRHYRVLADSKGFRQRGIASWYGTKFQGKKTANGEVYDMYRMTAAHKTLPIPSYVKVTNLKNRRTVVVRINDRGPFHDNRIIDLSYAAAVKLGIQQTGTGFVEIETLQPERATSRTSSKKTAKPFARETFYLQIGAFRNPLNARQLQQKLATIQLTSSHLKVTQAQGNTLYKVQIGPLASKKKADEITTRLTEIGLTATKIAW